MHPVTGCCVPERGIPGHCSITEIINPLDFKTLGHFIPDRYVPTRWPGILDAVRLGEQSLGFSE